MSHGPDPSGSEMYGELLRQQDYFHKQIDELRSQNAALQDKLDVLCEPGTPIAIVKAMFDFAIAECGHQRHSSRHAMTTIRETITALRERNAELEADLKRSHQDVGQCENNWGYVSVQLHRALSELAAWHSLLGKCPTCQSPAPHLHPAMQFEGEVQPCRDAYHQQWTPENARYLASSEGLPTDTVPSQGGRD